MASSLRPVVKMDQHIDKQRHLQEPRVPPANGVTPTPKAALTAPEVEKLYPPLTEPRTFRTFVLLEGSRDEPLRGMIWQPLPIDQTKYYEALSYRWSDFDPKTPTYIDIDGIQFPIGVNLHSALVQLRYPRSRRHLWVDQICINQSPNNREDRPGQVKLMGDIYSNAHKVQIWLGEGSQQTDVAMEFFPVLVDRLRRDSETAARHGRASVASDIVPHRGTIAQCLTALFSEDWFSRVWTLQELALAKTGEVRCGSKVFPISILEEFQQGCDNDYYGIYAMALAMIASGNGSIDPNRPVRPLNSHVSIVSLARQKGLISNARLLNSLRFMDSTRHSDRVNAILHFTDQALRDEVSEHQRLTVMQPTADESTEQIQELYQLVATYELRHGEMEHLCAAGLSQHRISYIIDGSDAASSRPQLSLPSWVPDWTYTIRSHSFWVYNSERSHKQGESLFTAGATRSADDECSFTKDNNVLTLRAVVFDEIDERREPLSVARAPHDVTDRSAVLSAAQALVQAVRSLIAACLQLATDRSPHNSDNAVIRSTRRTLVGGIMPSGEDANRFTGVFSRVTDDALYSLYSHFDTMLAVQERSEELSRRMLANEITDPEEIRAVTKFFQEMPPVIAAGRKLIDAVIEVNKGRRFFTTAQEHYIGLGPEVIQQGDKLCVVPGCPAPFAVRPVGEHLKLIGECYVDGVMDGEIMADKRFSLTKISII